MKNIDKNMKFLSQNHEKSVLGVSLWLLGRPLGPQGRQRRKSEPKGGSLDPPPQEGPQSGPKMGPFFFGASGTLKKEVREGLQKYNRFLVDVGVCPEGLRRVPVSTAAQFSLLQPAQKGLQNGSQNGAFWAPKSELYSLWGTFWEKLGPKNGEKKRT